MPTRQLTGSEKRLVTDLRARNWEVSAILRRFEERGWVDPFDFVGNRQHYNAILRYVHDCEGGPARHKGRVNPYTERLFRLTPQMIVEARRWRDADKPLADLPRRFYEHGWLELGEVHYCWGRLKRIEADVAAMDEIADAVDTFDRLTGKGRRQGWRISAEERRAIEQFAVAKATQHYRALGYEVRDVGASRSWDLECHKGTKELRVEVKGTKSFGSEILLTANEVDHARKHKNDLALFVLARVKVGTKSNRVVCSGGEAFEIRPWVIDRNGVLRALAYTYSVD